MTNTTPKGRLPAITRTPHERVYKAVGLCVLPNGAVIDNGEVFKTERPNEFIFMNRRAAEGGCEEITAKVGIVELKTHMSKGEV